MTSEDWRTVLLALIAMIGSIGAAMVAVYGQMLLKRANAAKDAAVTAVSVAADTKQLINGRMDQLLETAIAKAFAAGKEQGIATVAKVVAESPNVSLEGHDIAKAVVAATVVKV